MESLEFRRDNVDCSARVYVRRDFVSGGDTNVLSVSASGGMNLVQAQAYLAMVQEAVAHLQSLDN